MRIWATLFFLLSVGCTAADPIDVASSVDADFGPELLDYGFDVLELDRDAAFSADLGSAVDASSDSGLNIPDDRVNDLGIAATDAETDSEVNEDAFTLVEDAEVTETENMRLAAEYTVALTVTNALTAPWQFTLDGEPNQSLFTISVDGGGDEQGLAACYQLHGLSLNGRPWVHAPMDQSDQGLTCRSCPERVTARQTTGWFVLPRTHRGLLSGSFELSVSIRECKTGTMAIGDLGDPIPESVTVEVSAFSGVLPEVLPVSIQVVNASQFADSQTIESALLRVSDIYAAHGIEVVFEPLVEGANTSLAYEGGDKRALKTSLNAALLPGTVIDFQGVVPVFLVDCLTQEGLFSGTPEGISTAIPGRPSGMRVEDAVVIRMQQCLASGQQDYPWTSSALARVMAHEIGHFLGLYHSVESDGSEDALDDTGAENLMHHSVLSTSSTALSSAQLEILRRHAFIVGAAQE